MSRKLHWSITLMGTLFPLGVTFIPLAAQGISPRSPAKAPITDRVQIRPQNTVVASRPPFQLNAHEAQRVEPILNFWESRSAKVKTYECRFTRWEYDFVFGPQDPTRAKTISQGLIKYAAPDKGMFRVETMGTFKPPNKPGGQPTYPPRDVGHGEHWVCDGRQIYEFNAKNKQLIETQLPPNLQGKAITDGPLPFLFGAKVATLKQRYWIRELPPPNGVKTEYWLEAYPKNRRDASNFKRIKVILDKKLFLPIALNLYPPNYDEKRNPSHTVYRFDDRKVNNPVHQVQGFMNGFVKPRLPSGWTKHVEKYNPPAQDIPRVAPARMPANQARRPTPQRLR